MSAEWVAAWGQVLGALGTLGAFAAAFFVLQREQWDRRREAVRQVRLAISRGDVDSRGSFPAPSIVLHNEGANAIRNIRVLLFFREATIQFSQHNSVIYPGEADDWFFVDHYEPPPSGEELLSVHAEVTFSDYRGYRWMCDHAGQIQPVRTRPHWPPWIPLHYSDRVPLAVRNPVLRRLDDAFVGEWWRSLKRLMRRLPTALSRTP